MVILKILFDYFADAEKFTDIPFRLILLINFISIIVFRINSWAKNRNPIILITREKQTIPFYYLLTILIVIGIVAVIIYIFNPLWLKWASFSLPVRSRWFGIIWLSFNTSMLFWAHKSLGRHFGINLEIHSEHELVRHGLYSVVRHPIYTILVLEWFSIILVTANWFFLISAFGAIFRVKNQASLEENMMIEAFGNSYLEYKKTTGRFLPRIIQDL